MAIKFIYLTNKKQARAKPIVLQARYIRLVMDAGSSGGSEITYAICQGDLKKLKVKESPEEINRLLKGVSMKCPNCGRWLNRTPKHHEICPIIE